MRLGPDHLIRADLARYVPESRAFYAARGARRGPASLAELLGARARQGTALPDEGVVVERIAGASGREVPLRIAVPRTGDVRGAFVGTADVLFEDNLAMAARLAAAGNDVELRVYPEAPHGFTGHPTAMARAAAAERDAWLLGRLGASA